METDQISSYLRDNNKLGLCILHWILPLGTTHSVEFLLMNPFLNVSHKIIVFVFCIVSGFRRKSLKFLPEWLKQIKAAPSTIFVIV